MKLSILVLRVAALVLTALPVLAEDGIIPYAHLNLWTGWSHRTEELGEGMILVDEVGKPKHEKLTYQSDAASTASTHMGLTGEKSGVRMKAELGVYPYTQKGVPVVTVRYFYAATDFGPLELRGGYDLSPYAAINRNEVCDGEIFADAAMFESFQPQIRLTAHGAYFQIMRAVVNNSDLYLDSGLVGIGVLTTTANTRSVIPKMALGYIHKLENLSIGAHGVYQTYTIDDPTSSLDGEAITAYMASVAMTGEFGPFSVNLSGFYGQNPGELGIFSHNNRNGNYVPYNAAANNKAKTDLAFHLQNTTGSGISASGGYHLGMAQINAGFAYDRAQNKVFKTPLFPTDVDDAYILFANCSFALRENLKLTPSVKVINYLKTPGNAFQVFDAASQPVLATTNEGVMTRFGFAFQASL
jgi:hypothetical protein